MNDTPGPGMSPASEPRLPALDLALDDQGRRWRAGTPVSVETYLQREPALGSDTDAVLDLIYNEVLLRTERQENPRLDEYRSRFPHLAEALVPLFEVHQAVASDVGSDTTLARGKETLRPQTSGNSASPPEVPGYELLQRLGHGGMGVVYKARQKSLDRTVAVKMMLSGAHASPEELARFGREAEAVARLLHPNIVQIHEIGDYDGRPFLTLEFVDGGSLDRKLAGAPQPAREAAALVETLARAVHHAHTQGVVHRDLKPGNVLLTANGTPKIADFGLARLGAGSGQTQSGEVLGTPSYMAPEQAAGKVSAIGPATDVYALGAILYELLTGRPPFRADNPMETLRQVLEHDPVPPTRLRPNVPRDLETVCMKCLQKAPHKRYSSAEALADDLHRFLDGWPILARPTPSWERGLKWARRQPALAALYAVSAAALVAVFLYNIWLQSALTDANTQRTAAKKAQATAEEALETRRQQLVQVLLADGTRRLDEGDWFGALLPFAQAYSLDQKDAGRAVIHQTRLASILRQCPRLVQYWPHDHEVREAEFSPDGRYVLAAAGNSARLWDVATGKEVCRLSHDKEVRATAFSADGRQAATAADDRTVRLWEAASGRLLGQVLQDDEVLRVAFVADTSDPALSHVAIVTRKPKLSLKDFGRIRIQLWDVVKGIATSPALDAPAGVLLDVALSPDGRRALTVDSGDGGSLTVWDVGNARSVFKAGGSAEPTHARFSDDGRLVAVADVTGAVRIWDAASGKPFAGVRMQTVRHLTISHDHRFLVAGCLDGTARVWRLPEGQLVAELKHGPAFTHAVNQVAFSTDGRRHILVAGADNTARIWTEARPATPSLRHSDRVTRASFSPDGRLVLTACADGTVRVWDLAAGRLSAPPLEHDALVTRAEFDRTGRLAVTASEDRTARVWDATSGRAQGSRLVHSSPVRSAAFAVDGRVVTTSEDHTRGEGEACVWDAATGKLLFQRATAQVVPGVSPSDRGVHRAWFSPDGRTLLTLNQKGGCQVWDTVAGGPLTEILEHKSAITGASFNADASRLLTQTFLPENTIRLWESAGKPLSELFHFVQPDNTATVWEIPAGKRLASVGEPGSAVAFRHASFGWEGTQPIFLRDGAAEICDAATGQVIRAFRKPGTTITRAALSPNGQILVTISDDRTAQLWHAATGKIITTPPQFQHAGQNLPPGESWSPRFSPDGRFLVLSAPGGVRIWDAHGGDPVSPPLMHPAQVESVSFSPDGRLLLTASDRAARVWPLHAEDWGADDWLSLAELLSCARSHPDDGRLVPSRASELTPAWDRLRPKFSGAFATSPHDVTVWHAELQAKK